MTNPLQREVLASMPAWKRYWPAGVMISCGLIISGMLFSTLRRWENRDIEAEFCVEAADRAMAVKTAFDAQVALLKSVQAAFEGFPQISRQEFQKLLAPFREPAGSIFAVEWVPRVPHSERGRYEDAARREGLEGFRFTESDSRGQIVRAAGRAEYYPVFYIGPEPGNPLVFGYDLASEPTRLEVLRRTCDSGKIQASRRIAFLQDPTVQNAFLVLLPVYEQGKPLASLEDRRRNFRGAVLGVFRPDVLMGKALARLQPEGIDVALYDSTAKSEKQAYYFHASRDRQETSHSAVSDDEKTSQSRHYASFEVGGHAWTLECTAIPAFSAARQTWWPWVGLAAGIVFSIILTAYVSSTLVRHAYAERLIQEKRLYARGLEAKVNERTEELRGAQEEIIQRLVAASLWRDQETGMHIRRTGLYSEALAKAAGWSAAEAEILRQAAPMHDVGKIGIPDAILRKPGKLSDQEYRVIKTHTLIGAEMLGGSRTPMLQMAREIALYHHEYWDGNGYPMGLSGQQIPESARIMAIVDVFDALTHDRVYRRALPVEEALEIMVKESGTHFDSALMTLFLTIQPEIDRISKQFPDNDTNDMKLVRSFASILARSNTTEAEALFTAIPGLSPLPGQ